MSQQQFLTIDALQCSNWNRELFEELRAGDVTCVHVTCAVWENARATLDNLSQWYRWLQQNSDILQPVYQGSDIEQAQAEQKTGVILGFQNASPLENDLGLVEVFHRLGVRVIQLTYNNQNPLGSSCYEANDSGLARFGREVIREMNRLGMIIDLSHVGEKTSLGAIEASERPVAITHANPNAIFASKRNKSDTLLKALTERGGLLGCSLYPHFIGGNDTSLRSFCEMIAYAVELMGIDQVGFGSDSVRKCTPADLNWLRMGRWTHAVDYGPSATGITDWPEWQSWFQSPADFPNIAQGLREIGFSDEEVGKLMGGNWYRFFNEGFAPL